MRVSIRANEFQKDGSFRPADYTFEGAEGTAWRILRNGRPHLELGPGCRMLRSRACGVCSTDLARQFLPFPLPQITGHEVLALDEGGQRVAVEINASHAARGLDADCAFCDAGLEHHCPSRLVLGIHDLPGGFGSRLLAPVNAVIPVPDTVSDATAVLIEPLAAALHAVTTIGPRPGDRIAVLGPRRLGMLVIAALEAHRRQSGVDFEILALARRRSLLDLAELLGAGTAIQVEGDGAGLPSEMADVVVDTTGTPQGLELALRLARREVHLKSTHGRSACGLKHLTELVVDEINIGRLGEDALGTLTRADPTTVAWLASGEARVALPASANLVRGSRAADMLQSLTSRPAAGGLPRADVAVVDNTTDADSVIRPDPKEEVSLVRPGGWILLDPAGHGRDQPSALADAVVHRGLRLTSSRCGDFRSAIRLLEQEPQLEGIGGRLVTHTFGVERIAEAFSAARAPDCIKAVVQQESS